MTPAFDLSRPRVMGVVNVTPDSFSDGGQFYDAAGLSLDRILRRVADMVAEGATFIDVGGESTRPGAATVSLAEEMDRVLPVVTAIRREFDTIVSVDTSRPELMREAARAGAGLLNDVRALQAAGAAAAAAATGLPVCLMHMQGEPADMQKSPRYHNVVEDVVAFLEARITDCETAGIARGRIIVDPGFGFGKTVAHNLQLLHRLRRVTELGCPVLVGLSRKSLVGAATGRPISERLAGSVAAAALAVTGGARIVRAHDVAATLDAVNMAYATMRESVDD